MCWWHSTGHPWEVMMLCACLAGQNLEILEAGAGAVRVLEMAAIKQSRTAINRII